VDSSESSAAMATPQVPTPSHDNRAHYECVSLQHLSKVRRWLA